MNILSDSYLRAKMSTFQSALFSYWMFLIGTMKLGGIGRLVQTV